MNIPYNESPYYYYFPQPPPSSVSRSRTQDLDSGGGGDGSGGGGGSCGIGGSRNINNNRSTANFCTPTTPQLIDNAILKSFLRSNTQESEAISESPSALVIKQIVQDLVDLQTQIIGSKPTTTKSSANVTTGTTPDLTTTIFNTTSMNNTTDMESVILKSSDPIEIEGEEITVNGQRGIWANRMESAGWRGEVPLDAYPINQDPAPEFITKKSKARIEFVQEMAIRYLRPPTPPAPGEIIIRQEPSYQAPPMPPIIIRQQPARPSTPEPLVIREHPPRPPPHVGRKIITICGKKLPPPPRKVIIERLAPLPAKPQAVIVERWLPYSQVKRRVIFCKAPEDKEEIFVKPKNVIIQWEGPQVNIKKEYKYLGVIKANPTEYINRYGSTLTRSNQLPHFVREIKNPAGLVLAADMPTSTNEPHELCGDVHALGLVDLEREGLVEYSTQLNRMGITTNLNKSASAANILTSTLHIRQPNHQQNQQPQPPPPPPPLRQRPSLINSRLIVGRSKCQTLAQVQAQAHAQAQSQAQAQANAQTKAAQQVQFKSQTIQPLVLASPVQTHSPIQSPMQTPSSHTTQTPKNTPSQTPAMQTSPTSTKSSPNNRHDQTYLRQIDEIFNYIDQCQSGSITLEDAEKILLRINSRLGRRYGEDDVRAFFMALDSDQDGLLDLSDFKRAFLNLGN